MRRTAAAARRPGGAAPGRGRRRPPAGGGPAAAPRARCRRRCRARSPRETGSSSRASGLPSAASSCRRPTRAVIIGQPAGQQLGRCFFRQRRHARDGQVALVEEAGSAGPAGGEQAHGKSGQAARHHAEHQGAGRSSSSAGRPRRQQAAAAPWRPAAAGPGPCWPPGAAPGRSVAQAQGHVQGPGMQRAQVRQLGQDGGGGVGAGRRGRCCLEPVVVGAQYPHPGAAGEVGGLARAGCPSPRRGH